MSELYTSAVHLKRLLEGQATPAFTPAPESVLKVLDPRLFPGMGALNEDAEGRLQCPVRGCGEWHHDLFRHCKKHNGIGGAAMIKQAVGIPRATPLQSKLARSAAVARLSQTERRRRRNLGLSVARKPGEARVRRETTMSATQRNFLDRCPAQLAERITLLAKKIGRNPSHEDFKNEYGRGVFDAVRHVYGTWTNAKAFCGFGALNRTGVEHVLTALATWRDANGRLPTAGEVQMRSKAPALPAYKTILKAFGVETWAAAMSSVEAHLRKAS